MSKYIDAEKLYEKVDSLMAHYAKAEEEYEDDLELSIFYQGKKKMCSEIIELIATLQQEQPEKSFCEENCKGYRDTRGKCFFGFNCSAKKAHEQPKVSLEDLAGKETVGYVFNHGDVDYIHAELPDGHNFNHGEKVRVFVKKWEE